MELLLDSNAGISIDDFREMVRSMAAEELASIPIDKLPDNIPDDVIALAPEASKSVIEDLIFELNTREIHFQMELTKYFKPDLIDALNLAKNYIYHPFYDLFKRKVSELLVLYKRWEKSTIIRDRALLIPKIHDIDCIIPEFKLETKTLIRARQLLEENLPNAKDYRGKFLTSICELNEKFNQIETTLGRYFYLRLAIIGSEMVNLEAKLKNSDLAAKSIQQQIDDNHAELSKLEASSFFKDATKKEMIHKLKKQISVCIEEKRCVEVFISETDLISWLDVIVDASISSVKLKNSDNTVCKVRRSLYRLLNKYCESQENAALQIARNPFLQGDPKRSIKFMIQSEQFILNYFANKRSEMAAWLGDAAESKMDCLLAIERQLLMELKRNAKLKKS